MKDPAAMYEAGGGEVSCHGSRSEREVQSSFLHVGLYDQLVFGAASGVTTRDVALVAMFEGTRIHSLQLCQRLHRKCPVPNHHGG